MGLTDTKQGTQRSPRSIPSPHPLQEREVLLSSTRLLDVAKFANLERPLPRAQDLPAEYFGTPSSSNDQVISVSHAWRNQAHPDPTCHKMDLLGPILSKIIEGNGSTCQSSYLFLDFISISQRPFRPDQVGRTTEEVGKFRTALACMHEVYFYSDRIIHLPWEDVVVPGEGEEDEVPVEVLKGATFAKVGDCVQVAHQGAAAGASSACRVRLFDQVISVDGKPIKSLAQVESLLEDEGEGRTARLRRFPFGNYSKIPAEARGWVFLERFISMVKCAMMEEGMAERVVITPSAAIKEQIMRGARLLREASLREAKQRQKRGELKRVLETFIVELKSKHFSPASIDKHELTKCNSYVDDQEIVGRIMQHFVEHLSLHWEAEAAKQRSLARRLTAIVTAAETYLVEWDRFSEDCTAKLSDGSSARYWPVAFLTTVPLVVTLATLLWPYSNPDESWAAQAAFWSIGEGGIVFFGYLMFPIFVASTTDLGNGRAFLLLSAAWAAGCSAVCLSGGVAISGALQIFPVPMLHIWGASIAVSFLPLLWWGISREKRASKGFRRRLFASIFAMMVVITLFAVAVPLLNASVPLVSVGWQALLLSAYLGLKLGFEVFSRHLSKIVGADAMPYFVFLATYAYQVNLCLAFSKVSSWVLVIEQVCFDVIENFYHLYSLSRQQSPAQELYIVASLVVREFTELVAPASFVVFFVLARAFRWRSFEMFCGRSEEEVERSLRFLLADLATELAVSLATCGYLVRRRHAPLLLLRNLCAPRLLCFTIVASTTLSYYCAMQHSHWGMDLGFRFTWLAEEDAAWECGLTWTAPSGGRA